jgi:hypothetical protein
MMGYMCKIAWDHEAGEDFNGTTIYWSLKSLYEHHSFADSCGIVQVEVSLTRLISEGDGT